MSACGSAAGASAGAGVEASARFSSAPDGRKLLRLEVRNAQTPIERKPEWIKTKARMGPEYQALHSLVKSEELHTVCQEAGCPNIYECWEDREATFLIGGSQCTRRCDFCQIDTGKPADYDTDEPRRVAESVVRMNLRYATVTGVARDDPLDGVRDWNRMYGPRGFLQYQCVLPPDRAADAVAALLREISASGQGSFLAVLKPFGARTPAGMLSFPRAGTTLALDFPNTGPKLMALLERLDAVTAEAGGAVYPAKDARWPGARFRAAYSDWQAFLPYVDPRFSSGFWRRAME